MTKEIELTQDYKATVDDEDFEYLNQFKWSASNGYALHNTSKQLMHRVVLGRMLGRSLSRSECGDHINANRADNRRCNLRLASHSQNQANRGAQRNSTTKYKGVFLDKLNNHSNPYRARIRVNQKNIHLGYYSSPQVAALAYDEAAIKYFGEFAYTNFPKEDYDDYLL